MIPREYAARKLPLRFDGARLFEDLARVQEHEWVAHPYSELGGTLFKKGFDHIAVLIADDGAPQNIMPTVTSKRESRKIPVLPTPLLGRCSYFKEVLDSFRCDFNIVRLMAMEPGVIVKTHIDAMRTGQYQIARIHVPLVTNPNASLFVQGRQLQPQVGECWYLDAAVPHSVQNLGDARRVHMVMDCIVNDSVNELVGFDIIEFRKSHAQEYNRLWARFLKQLQRRRTLHEWNAKIKTATGNAVDRSREIARRMLYLKPKD
jgi:hypothetical protein